MVGQTYKAHAAGSGLYHIHTGCNAVCGVQNAFYNSEPRDHFEEFNAQSVRDYGEASDHLCRKCAKSVATVTAGREAAESRSRWSK